MIHLRIIICWLACVVLALSTALGAQTPAQPDSSKPVKKSDLEGPIRYEGRRFINLVDQKKTVLLGQAKVTYQDMILTAEKITVDWDTKIVTAEGVPDSGWVKTSETDSTFGPVLRGAPQFTESGDVMNGETMTFNFSTKKGRVVRGRTAYEDGFYNGTAIKMLSRNTLNVAKGAYTTCDKPDHPHFQFRSDKMKILVNDKLVAKPIVLYVGNIPVFALPFIYFPIQRDRHSGFIIPSYGNSSQEGRYLRGLGYYWAASEYWDVKGTADYFEKSGFLFQGDLNYNIRYRLNGSISGSWTRKHFEYSGVRERRWDLSVNHQQTLSPTLDLSVNGTFVSSGDFYRELSANRERRLQRNMISNARLSKRFEGGQSVQVNFNQTRDLTTDELSETLPEVSIYLGQTAIFGRPETKRGEIPESRWYHSIYASYSSQFTMKHDKVSVEGESDTAMQDRRAAGWDHSIGLSSSQKLFGWLNFNPAVSVQETWLDRRREDFSLDTTSNTFSSHDRRGFFSLRTFYATASFGSKLYGLFPVLPNAVIRHVATPNVSFNFQPDFSESRWGYVESLPDTAGKTTRLDHFGGDLFRSTPFGGRQAMQFGLNNLFQMKIKQGEQEKKFDLFTWNLSTAYNWKATQFKFSDLSSRIQANPASNLSLSFSSNYSFYRTDSAGNNINRLYWEGTDWDNWSSLKKLRFARLTNLNASLSLNLRGKGESTETQPAASPETPFATGLTPNRFEFDEQRTQFGGPWSLNASINYTESRYNPLSVKRTCWANGSFNIKLTKNWNVSYSAQWDAVKREMVSQDFTFRRDLHCWEGLIMWSPTGYKRFYVRINVKSTVLKDLKVEKGTGQRGIYGY